MRECPVPHLSHRSQKLGGQGPTPAPTPERTLVFEHPALAALALLVVVCDDGESVLAVGDAGARLEALGPSLAVKVQRIAEGSSEALWTAIGPRTRAVVLAAEVADEDVRALVGETDVLLVLEGAPSAEVAEALVLSGAHIEVGEALPLELSRRLAHVARASQADLSP